MNNQTVTKFTRTFPPCKKSNALRTMEQWQCHRVIVTNAQRRDEFSAHADDLRVAAHAGRRRQGAAPRDLRGAAVPSDERC